MRRCGKEAARMIAWIVPPVCGFTLDLSGGPQHIGRRAARAPCGRRQEDSFDSNCAHLHMLILTDMAGHSKMTAFDIFVQCSTPKVC